MKIINKYLIKNIFFSVLFVSVAWVLIFSMFDFLTDSKNIGIGEYSFFDSMFVLLLKSLLMIYKNLIFILLIGVILALGNLASTSQIIVMRSVGYSINKIIAIVVAFVVTLYLIFASVGELLAPKLSEYATTYKSEQTGRAISHSFKQQFWIKDKDLVMHIGKNYDGKNFADMNIFEVKNNKLNSTTWAKRANIEHNIATLGEVKSNKILDESIIFSHQKNKKLNILFDNTLIETLQKDPLNLSIIDIYQQVKFLTHNNLNSGIFKIEFYKRLVKPFILITTILFAMLFIFGSMRNSTMGKKLFLGVAISLVLELYLKISGSIVLKFEYNYFVVVVLPIVLFFIFNIRLLMLKK